MAAFDAGVFDGGVFDVAAISPPPSGGTPTTRRSHGRTTARRAIGEMGPRWVAPNLQPRRAAG